MGRAEARLRGLMACLESQSMAVSFEMVTGGKETLTLAPNLLSTLEGQNLASWLPSHLWETAFLPCPTHLPPPHPQAATATTASCLPPSTSAPPAHTACIRTQGAPHSFPGLTSCGSACSR